MGKSTLLNKIAPDLELETGEISDSLGAVDTTWSCQLYPFKWWKDCRYPWLSSLDYEVTTSEDLNHALPRNRRREATLCKFHYPVPFIALSLRLCG